MRMEDGPTVEVDIRVEASPGRVWELVTDLARVGEWSPEYQGGAWHEGADGPAVGAWFKGRNKRGDREWESDSVVVESVAAQTFAWSVSSPDNPAATWRFDLQPDGSGTQVRHHVRLGPGPSGLTARIAERPDREEDIVSARCAEVRRNMQATLEGLKTAAEQGG